MMIIFFETGRLIFRMAMAQEMMLTAVYFVDVRVIIDDGAEVSVASFLTRRLLMRHLMMRLI